MVVTSVANVEVMVPVHGVKTVVFWSTSGVLTTIIFSVVGLPSSPVTVPIVVYVVVDGTVHGRVVVTTGTGHSFPSGTVKT